MVFSHRWLRDENESPVWSDYNESGTYFFWNMKWWADSLALSDKDLDFTDTRYDTTEPLKTGPDSSSGSDDDDLGTSASVQEEKREFEAGLSDLRHKLAQEVIIEEEEGKWKTRLPQNAKNNLKIILLLEATIRIACF